MTATELPDAPPPAAAPPEAKRKPPESSSRPEAASPSELLRTPEAEALLSELLPLRARLGLALATALLLTTSGLACTWLAGWHMVGPGLAGTLALALALPPLGLLAWRRGLERDAGAPTARTSSRPLTLLGTLGRLLAPGGLLLLGLWLLVPDPGVLQASAGVLGLVLLQRATAAVALDDASADQAARAALRPPRLGPDLLPRGAAALGDLLRALVPGFGMLVVFLLLMGASFYTSVPGPLASLGEALLAGLLTLPLVTGWLLLGARLSLRLALRARRSPEALQASAALPAPARP